MELRALAERVLFGEELESKLFSPETVTDEYPGARIVAPEAPGRPRALRFKPEGHRGGEFPRRRLEGERERGQVLHFFANHELLAVELMALALLRFPDAPESFRRGVFRTLREEQHHTRLYLDRMKACGVEFGELPVSGFFWRCVSGMECPLDYVSGLSLTFEQANLDFCLDFSEAFLQAGDSETAGLLKSIYRDEIAHVAYGLKWFRHWKEPQQSDWDAFRHQLRFPLSPRRAKGARFNAEGRRQAGFGEDFIAELSVFAMSKGRTPSVYWFNPFEELRMDAGDGFQPSSAQAALVEDLSILPMFLCRRDDVVLVSRRPNVGYLSSLQAFGFELPEFEETPRSSLRDDSALRSRKLGSLRPWSCGPGAEEILGPMRAMASGNTAKFNDGIRSCFAKSWSADFLRDWLEEIGPAPWLIPRSMVGRRASSIGQARQIIAEWRTEGMHRLVVKRDFGFAARNTLRLWEPEVLDSQWRWIEASLERGRALVFEPWLDRVADFSIQCELESRGLRILGYTGLENDLRGQFISNRASPDFARRPPFDVVRGLTGDVPAGVFLPPFFGRLVASLGPRLLAAGYSGPVGIDAFVYRDGDGAVRLKPVVEINPRFTMGRLTLELMRFVAPGSSATFRLVSSSELNGSSGGFSAWAAEQLEARPCRLCGAPKPKIVEGLVCLSDPSRARHHVAILEVRPRKVETSENAELLHQ